ncbi:MAG: ATP synthase F1 subunit delta [Alphaproteobacteria bacterium]|nr:MAG: ATP synthase F1 subunit delta [Alphaproteobacteria bacterium]
MPQSGKKTRRNAVVGPAHVVAGRYALALFRSAEAAGQLHQIEDEADALKRLLANSTVLQDLVRNPLYDCDDKVDLMRQLAAHAKLSPLMSKFLGVLAQRRRLNLLGVVLDDILARLFSHRGRRLTVVTSTRPMPEARMAQLQQAMEAVQGPGVVLEAHTDPSLLGGLTIETGGHLYDASIKRRLALMSRRMKEVS